MSQRHRLLIIGVGSIGERHTRCFIQTGRADVSICEPNEALRQKVSTSNNIQQSYASLDEALNDKHDAVLIATPAHTHISIAIQCADAGLAMLIEKPLALSLDGIDRLQQVVEEKKLVVGVAYVWRANPLVMRMKQALDRAKLGKPLQIYGVAAQHFPTFRPAYRDIYYKDRAIGGGAIQDAMTHILNLGEWFVGPITSLFADAAHLRLEDVTVEDTVHVIARHDQVMGSYILNQHQAANELTMTIVCEHGMLRFEVHQNRCRIMTEPNGKWQDEVLPDIQRDDSFIAQANMFLDAIENKQKPLCSLDQGVQTLKAIQAVLKSADAPAWSTV